MAGQPGNEAGKIEGLLRARGIDVRRARTALDAIGAMPGYEPDAVIVHWTALDVVGPKFLRMIKDAKLARMPFILANAAPLDMAPADRNDALIQGADAVMPGAPPSDELDAYLAMVARHKSRSFADHDRLRRVLGRLNDLQERFDSLDGDLLEARKLQQGLMRDRNVTLGGAEISLILRSSGHVGGDLVGHFPIHDRALGFYALDVSGHGVSSALMTARLAGYLSATNPRQNVAVVEDGDGWAPRPPAEAMAELNELVMDDLETDHYFTMLLGHVDPVTGVVTMCQAGHPHPVQCRAAGEVAFVGSGGLPVGLIPGADYDEATVTMAPGDRLFLLSDGFTEAELPDGELLGDKGIVRLLRASRSIAGPAALEALIWDLSQAIGETEFQDDLSGVLIEFSGSPKS